MTEIWKDIPSLPEYEASSFGRVRCRSYKVPICYGGDRLAGGKAIYGQKDPKSGRRHIVFRGKTYRMHKLICEAFHGSKPFKSAVCMHLDENNQNNTPDNLKWGTQKENLNAPGFIAYCKGRTDENSPVIKGRKKP